MGRQNEVSKIWRFPGKFRKNWFSPLTLNRYSSVTHELAKLLIFYFTTRARPFSKSHVPSPAVVGADSVVHEIPIHRISFTVKGSMMHKEVPEPISKPIFTFSVGKSSNRKGLFGCFSA